MLPKNNSIRLVGKEQTDLSNRSDKLTMAPFLNRINKFLSCSQNAWSENERFCHYPNGFYINRDIEAASFLKSNVTETTGKDVLAIFLSRLKLYRLLKTRTLKIPRPDNILGQNENIQALKFINESLIIWTDRTVYKLPVSDLALKRMQQTRIKAEILETLELQKKAFYLIPHFLQDGNYLIQYSKKCRPTVLDSDMTQKLDGYLHDYFTVTLKDNASSAALPVGLQHGDLHYRNIFVDESNKLWIADIDMLSTDGHPFLDLIHFAVHLVRNRERCVQYAPLKRFIKDRNYLNVQLLSYGFKKLSSLWVQCYLDDYIPLYIDNQKDWYRSNQIVGDELAQLEQIERDYGK